MPKLLESDLPELPAHSQTDLAYAAGLFDGEGCITTDAYKNPTGGVTVSMRVTFNNTFKGAVDWLGEMFPGGSAHASGDTRGGTKKPLYATGWRGPAAARMLKCMLPFLYIKREEALLAIELQERIYSTRIGRGRKLSDEELGARLDLAARIKELKRVHY